MFLYELVQVGYELIEVTGSGTWLAGDSRIESRCYMDARLRIDVLQFSLKEYYELRLLAAVLTSFARSGIKSFSSTKGG